MNSRNSVGAYKVAELRRQLELLTDLVNAHLEPNKADEASANQAMYRSSACNYALTFGMDANSANIISELEPDPFDAVAFLRVAAELLAEKDPKTKASFIDRCINS